MNFWTPENIRVAVAGAWLARPPEGVAIDGVATDTRAVRPGQAFLALAGERFDAHDFVQDAVAAGSPLLVVDRDVRLDPVLARSAGVIKVPDTRRALGRLAHAYRRSLERVKVVAVCGSNGKTTTVRLLEAILATRLRGSASPKSFNNDIGVPLTILAAKPSDQYLVCEVGTNAPGEIAALARIVEPDIAVITSIGREHLEFLGDLAGVAREEAAVLPAVRPGGTAVVPADVPALREHLRRAPAVLTFGHAESADLRITRVAHVWGPGRPGDPNAAEPNLEFSINDRWIYRTPLVGAHNALNAAAAIAVARRLGVDDDYIAAGLASAAGPEMRWQRRAVGGVTFVNDAYNANPESALAAVRTLADLYPLVPGRRRIIVLGDMRELGPAAPALHAEVGEAIAAAAAAEVVVTVGPLARHAADALRARWNPRRVAAIDDLDARGAAEVLALFQPGDVVLLKGSRRMRLERLLHAAEIAGRPAVSVAPGHPGARAAT